MTNTEFQEKTGFQLHPAQKEIAKCKEREIVICAGRRWGKSAICGYAVAKRFIELWKEVEAGKRDSIKIWIVAPTYDLSRKVYAYVVKFLLKIEPNIKKCMTDRPAPQIRFSEAIWIQCKSTTEPQSLLGEELDMLVLDEAANISKRIWFDYLIPTTASKERKCQTLFISTPRGKNWFYDLWLSAKEKGAAFHFTSLDGVSINQEEWDRIKASSPKDLFQQNFEATFLEEAATVFRGIRDIINPNCLKGPEPGQTYIMGVDLAQINDFTVLFVIDKSTNTVVHKDRFQKLTYPLQVKRIYETAMRYNNAKIVLELNNVGISIANTLQEQGARVEGFKTVGTISKDFEKKGSKQKAIEKLSVDIEHKNLTIPDWEVLIDELSVFGCEWTAAGNVKYGAPEGFHDDCVIALALANWGLQSKAKIMTNQAYQAIPPTKKVFQYH
jgi:hypothetical protein